MSTLPDKYPQLLDYLKKCQFVVMYPIVQPLVAQLDTN